MRRQPATRSPQVTRKSTAGPGLVSQALSCPLCTIPCHRSASVRRGKLVHTHSTSDSPALMTLIAAGIGGFVQHGLNSTVVGIVEQGVRGNA